MATLSLAQTVKNVLQTPMAALSEMGYTPVFSDSAIYMGIYDAIPYYNFEFNASIAADLTLVGGLATAISITPTLDTSQSFLISRQAVLLLFQEWARVNLFDGELGVAVRDGLGSISTQGRATHVTKALQDLAKDVRRFMMRQKIRNLNTASTVRNTGEA